jgi:trk system potassium uptake protein TrkA
MMRQQLYVVIAGCGELGSAVATELSREGASVVVIDIDERALAGLSNEYGGFRLQGDATELAVLKQAKVGQADRVIAVTGEDNVNVMVAQVAKAVFGVPRTLARVEDPRREAIYREMGVETVCPTAAVTELILRTLAGEPGEGRR